MWKFNDETFQWEFDGFTQLYFFGKRIYQYPLTTCWEKLNLSITEAAICTQQKIEHEDFKEWRKAQR